MDNHHVIAYYRARTLAQPIGSAARQFWCDCWERELERMLDS